MAGQTRESDHEVPTLLEATWTGDEFQVTERVKTSGHTTFYLAYGASDAPLIICVHRRPELSRRRGRWRLYERH
jgi:hypothetical protein